MLPSETVTWTPMLAAVAVFRTIRTLTTLDVRLKWPNDVLAIRGGVGRKLAGILVDAVGTGPASGRAVVVGIGINVNMAAGGFREKTPASAPPRLLAPRRLLGRGRPPATRLGECVPLVA